MYNCYQVIDLRNSVKTAVGGLCAALSVVLMFLGGLSSVLIYAVPMLLGTLMCMIKKTFGTRCAIGVYISVSILSFVLVADKECVLMYALFFGYYPIIKDSVEKIKKKLPTTAAKFLIFNICITAAEFVSFYVFGIPFFDDGKFSVWFIALFAVLMNLLFVLYDVMLNRFYLLYRQKLENRIKKLLK